MYYFGGKKTPIVVGIVKLVSETGSVSVGPANKTGSMYWGELSRNHSSLQSMALSRVFFLLITLGLTAEKILLATVPCC